MLARVGIMPCFFALREPRYDDEVPLGWTAGYAAQVVQSGHKDCCCMLSERRTVIYPHTLATIPGPMPHAAMLHLLTFLPPGWAHCGYVSYVVFRPTHVGAALTWGFFTYTINLLNPTPQNLTKQAWLFLKVIKSTKRNLPPRHSMGSAPMGSVRTSHSHNPTSPSILVLLSDVENGHVSLVNSKRE